MERILIAAVAAMASVASAATLAPIQLLNPAGSTAGQAIVSTGASSPPAWSNVVASSLAPVGANTVIANTTGSTAAPTAFAMPSCSTNTSALQYTNGVGFTCFAGSAPLASPAFTGTATFAARPVFGSATPWDSANLASPASTTGNLSQFASTTSAQLAGVISNETGSGALVFGTSPTLTSPSFSTIVNSGTLTLPTSTDTLVGRATTDTLTNKTLTSPTVNGGTLSGTFAGAHTYSGAVTFSSTITPSQTAGIVGTTTNNNAQAGSVGEYVSNTPSGVALSSATFTNVGSISLTAGDWDVRGGLILVGAGGTAITNMAGGVSTASATLGANGTFFQLQSSGLGTDVTYSSALPTQRVSISATTTVYCVGYAQFTGGSVTATCKIDARRMR
jgi:hypothetical protein